MTSSSSCWRLRPKSQLGSSEQEPTLLTKFRLAAFDLDGTLVDSAPDLHHCLGHALDSVGLPRPSLVDARSWIGDGIETLIQRALEAAIGGPAPSATHSHCLSEFDDCYRSNLFRLSRLYSDVDATLGTLSESGLTVGCITNKRETYARQLLRQAGIAHHFRFICGGDTFARKKPDPEPLLRVATEFNCPFTEAVMIGDSENDQNAAASAGFAFVFAAYGYATTPPAARTAIGTVARFSELPGLLCRSTHDK